jgi:CTD small phosphatase-like protein 2
MNKRASSQRFESDEKMQECSTIYSKIKSSKNDLANSIQKCRQKKIQDIKTPLNSNIMTFSKHKINIKSKQKLPKKAQETKKNKKLINFVKSTKNLNHENFQRNPSSDLTFVKNRLEIKKKTGINCVNKNENITPIHLHLRQKSDLIEFKNKISDKNKLLKKIFFNPENKIKINPKRNYLKKKISFQDHNQTEGTEKKYISNNLSKMESNKKSKVIHSINFDNPQSIPSFNQFQSSKKINPYLKNKKSKAQPKKIIESKIIRKKLFSKLDLSLLFKNEDYIYQFFVAIYEKKDIYDIFKNYIDFIQDNSLEVYIKLIDKKLRNSYKNSFILENTTLMIIFYLLLNRNYENEIIFIRNLILSVYSNLYSFIFLIIDSLSDNDEICAKYLKDIERITNREIKKYNVKLSRNLKENNWKILKYIKLQIKLFEPKVFNSILKILEFLDDFDLREGFDYLLKTFSEIYNKKGAISTNSKVEAKKEFLDVEAIIENSSEKSSTVFSDTSRNFTYTLVLDLDETLVHCKEENNEGKVFFRPYVDHFLEEMSKYYEIFIFTAALEEYANEVLDYLDPEKKVISQRFYRQHLGENSVKDLTKLDRDLSKCIIIDNLPENFDKQQDNGIFIKSWYNNDSNDTALKELIPILKEIVQKKTPDVRVFLKNYRQKMIDKIKRGSLNPKDHFS